MSPRDAAAAALPQDRGSRAPFPLLAASCGHPPDVANARLFGRKRQRYESGALARYYCEDGFVQTLPPVVRCLPTGQWEQPLVTCRPSE